MKYIKLYQNESDYLDEIGENPEAVLPNISLVGGGGVKLNPNPTREAYFNTDDVEDPIFSNTNQHVKSIFSEMYLNDDNENLIKHYEIIEGSFTILSDTDLEYIQGDKYPYLKNTSKKSITARNIESYIIECDEPLLADYFIGISFGGGVAGSGGAFPPYGIIPYGTLYDFFNEEGLDINDYRIDENTIDITTVLNKLFGSVGNLCVVIIKRDSDYNAYPINTHNHYKIEELPEQTVDVLYTSSVEGIILDFKLECNVEILPTDVLFYCENGEYYEFGTVESTITNYGPYYGFGLSEDRKSIVPNENFVPSYGITYLYGIMRDGNILSHECKILGTNDNFYIYPDKLGENKIRFVLKDRFAGIDCFAANTLLTRLNNNALDYNRFIPYEAYSNCISLTNINIPNSVTSIGEDAFEVCLSLTSINIPNSVTSIGDNAFYECRSLTKINIPNSVTSIGNYAFQNCSGLTNVNISDSVTSIKNGVFSGCRSLTNVNIPNSVTSIGSYAFYNCTSLTNVNIPDSVTSIEFDVFNGCRSLTNVNIPDSVTSIGNYAFRSCGQLTNINIPDSVTSIGDNAFSGCTNLTSVNISSLESWLNINFNNGSSNPLCNDGDLYLDGQLVTDLVIPNGITSIKQCVFNHCTSLTSVEIPDSVTSIGDYAFNWCSKLTSVEIPDSVTSIGKAAFQRCNNLTSINIPDSVTSIESHAFYACSLLSVELPNTITTINNSLFNRCSNLTSVTIPDSVTSIGTYVFYNCSNLSEIICYAMTAPSLGSTSVFSNVKTGGVLKVPTGATGYDTWMATSSDRLGYYNWTIEYI